VALPVCKHNLDRKKCEQCLKRQLSLSRRVGIQPEKFEAPEASTPAADGEMLLQ